MSKAKHLYIHIPFCNRICNYCDFVRSVACKKTKVEYVANIINQLNDLKNLKLKTLYIGGGTPNSLDYNTLKKLLKNCSLFLTKNTEFSIECNPKFVNKKQVALFKKYGINRISLGVQTLNENILREMNREQNNNDVIKAIKIFRKIGINNISCDFIYGFNNTTLNDIKNILIFINKYKIKHLSFYALEVKENSILAKNNYQLDNDKMDGELRLILKGLEKYQHYEISSWSIDNKHQSKHNLCYWKMHDWIGIGNGAYGLENRNYYYWENNNKINKILDDKEYYFQIISMGLRLKKGINLKKKNNLLAYEYFKNKLKYVHVKNNHLIANNRNKLNDILIELL